MVSLILLVVIAQPWQIPIYLIGFIGGMNVSQGMPACSFESLNPTLLVHLQNTTYHWTDGS
jgi:hypothetical protein